MKMIGTNEHDLRKWLLKNRQVASLFRPFANNSSANVSYWKLNYLKSFSQVDFLVIFLTYKLKWVHH